MKPLLPGWVVRPMRDTDLDAVTANFLDTWSRAYASGNFSWGRFREIYASTPAQWLDEGFGLVACLPDVPDFIGGWLLGREWKGYDHGLEQPVVHYLYVKKLYRTDPRAERVGLATALIDAAGIDPEKPFRYTCTTKDWERMVQDRHGKKKPHWRGARWDPNLARYDNPPPNWRNDGKDRHHSH